MIDLDWSEGPEGATHYDMDSFGKSYAWIKESYGRWFSWNGDSWEKWFLSNEGDRTLIPRSVKQNLGSGLPRMAIMVNPHEAFLYYGDDHLGKEIEVIEHLPDESCYVVRFDWGLGVLHDSMIDFGMYELKSKAEKQREEFIEVVCDIVADNSLDRVDQIAAKVFDNYLSRYTLENKS